jgi:catechol-2,3-dioxygenase
MPGFTLQRLDHVSLNVSDRPRSIAWYRDVLGLEPRNEQTRDDWPVFLGERPSPIALFQAARESPAREPESTGLRHLALLVDREGIERAREHLEQRDIAVQAEDHGGNPSLYFKDPDGNTIELVAG